MEPRKRDLTQISVPSDKNPLIQEALKRVNENEELLTLWKCINVNAMDRLRMSDHGIVHFQIVSNIALKMARMLAKHGVELSIIKDHGLTHNHGELVIFLASIMHDLGMSINRKGHEEYSLTLANPLLHQILDFLPANERTIVISDTLHAIISHRDNGTPYTIEAEIVQVADALDMTEGRAKAPFSAGEIQIHSLSVAAIDSVEIKNGQDKPIQIDIVMNNSAGLFQVDELLKNKLKGSKIKEYIEVKAVINGDSEKKLLTEFVVK
jgi:uncharacterized protein